VVVALKAWRLAESKRKGVPAFRILTDQALFRVAEAEPESEQALLDISGVGPAIVRKYAQAILGVLSRVRE
jgi:DNA topoisomerase-3